MLLIIVFFVAAFGMNFQMTTALMSREVFHSGASSSASPRPCSRSAP